MSHELMLHFDTELSTDQRDALSTQLHEKFGAEAEVRDSAKPHLLFVSVDPAKASPHSVLETVKDLGYQAQLVDL